MVGVLVAVAHTLNASQLHAALAQTWPPFVLVSGLLLIGLVAGRDGLFDAAASRLMRFPGPPPALLLACFSLVAVVTALLNLDTSAVFLTPVLIRVAQRRRIDAAPFLYGAIFMANASSLFLPGSNLTNLLVLLGEHVSGGAFFTNMLPAALTASLLTAVGLLVIHRRQLLRVDRGSSPGRAEPVPLALGLGFWGALLAAVLILVLRDAALPVLAVGLLLVARRAQRGELCLSETLTELGAPALLGLFLLSVLLGTVARASAFPADAIHSAGAPLTAVVAALASIVINNLPAAVLLSATRSAHPGALLLGLNVGPNLAVTGSLAVLLWWRAARACGISPSAFAYSRQGLLLAPIAIIAALAVGGG